MSRDYGTIQKPQRVQVLDLLWDLKWHRHTDLATVGGVRYSARLLELKRLGYQIEDKDLEPKGKTYRLKSRRKGAAQAKRVKVFLSEGDAVAMASGGSTGSSRRAVKSALDSFRVNKDKL